MVKVKHALLRQSKSRLLGQIAQELLPLAHVRLVSCQDTFTNRDVLVLSAGLELLLTKLFTKLVRLVSDRHFALVLEVIPSMAPILLTVLKYSSMILTQRELS